MAYDLLPRSIFSFPALHSLLDDADETSLNMSSPSGLSVSEDAKHIYVEASVPGIDPKDIEITFDKGVLWIKGESKQETKEKKYYRRASNSFSYRVAVPGEIDLSQDPQAEARNGVMHVTFTKSPASQPRKITVKNIK